MADIPHNEIRIPAINSYFEAKRTKTINKSHGSAFGEFWSIPYSPPPKVSAPENKANMNNMALIIRRLYMAIAFKRFAHLILEFIVIY